MKGEREIRRRACPADAILPGELHPVLARLYAARGVSSAHELDHALKHLPSPDRLRGIAEAAKLIEVVLRAGERILVVADYDADGATSCALMLRALAAMGARDLRFLVPNRFEYGYGLTPETARLAAVQEPALLITVDNGISSIEGVRTARELGMRVLVTDHHLPGAELPEADAIVNPNQTEDGFPARNLAGVGVAFYVLLGLRSRLRESGWFTQQRIDEPNLARFLDLVALGTVADVVPLDHCNRILVAQGLERINAGRAGAGVRALLLAGGRHEGRVTAGDLGFVVGPRLNAAGRLEDMTLGINCLLSDDIAAAQGMARQLDQLNRERRSIEADMQTQAMRAVEALHLDGAGLPRGLCLFDEGWHQGVIGLVASRVKDRLHRPVIAFAPGGGADLKGSARSVPGLHIRDTLDTIAARHPVLLSRFGGHAMAAGLTLARANYQAFRDAFAEEVARQLSDDDLRGVIHSDGELADADLTLDLAERLRLGGPWGQAFPEPVFDGVFDVVTQRVVGERHLKLSLSHGASTFDAIAFGAAPHGPPTWPRVRAAYRLDVNEYQGRRALQLVIEHLEPAP